MLPLFDCIAGHAGHGARCGRGHMALGPALTPVHVHPGLTALGPALGAFRGAQSLPLGQRAS